jgi:hypothetical protein
MERRVKIRAIQRAAAETSLDLLRLPFDTAISMLPDRSTRVRPVAEAVVDGADARMRSLVSKVLGDPASPDHSSRRPPHGNREERDNGRGSDSHGARSADAAAPPERASKERGGKPPKPPARRQGEVSPGRPAAAVQPRAATAAPQTAPESRARAAAMTGTGARTADRTTGSGTRPRPRDKVTTEDQVARAPAARPSSEPSEQDIAARAYELYQRGVPGDANAHWEAAKRELTSASP